jgi:hypothetical protein
MKNLEERSDWQWHSWAIQMLSIFLKQVQNRLHLRKWTTCKKSSVWGRTVHSGYKIGQLLSKQTCVWFPLETVLITQLQGQLLPTWMNIFKVLCFVRVFQNEWYLHEWMTFWKWSCFSKAILEQDQKNVWIAPPLFRVIFYVSLRGKVVYLDN